MTNPVRRRLSNVISGVGFLCIVPLVCSLLLFVPQLAWDFISPVTAHEPGLEEDLAWLKGRGIKSFAELETVLTSQYMTLLEAEEALSRVKTDTALDARERDSLVDSVLVSLNALDIHDRYENADDAARELFEYAEDRVRYHRLEHSLELVLMASYLLPIWIVLALLNYIMVGSFRLLPWRGFED
jgi:hypothetical protein